LILIVILFFCPRGSLAPSLKQSTGLFFNAWPYRPKKNQKTLAWPVRRPAILSILKSNKLAPLKQCWIFSELLKTGARLPQSKGGLKLERNFIKERLIS
jgi:hypothetical protein